MQHVKVYLSTAPRRSYNMVWLAGWFTNRNKSIFPDALLFPFF
uniref:Photosystem I subunit IX n=1 Tax=Myriopteris lindheimeri TaxID=531291 RepID=E2J471_MYRLI|nr:photosystem I subunit IX [Myriopteris lindheimeri]ADL29866.1 photosystem I subunit IX [Myriopteris lindheimeri]